MDKIIPITIVVCFALVIAIGVFTAEKSQNHRKASRVECEAKGGELLTLRNDYVCLQKGVILK